MQAGMLAAFVADHALVEHVVAYSVRFASPLYIGETLVLQGTVESVNDGIAAIALTATASDRVIITGTARVRTVDEL